VDEEAVARELVEAHLRRRTRETLAIAGVLLVPTLGACVVWVRGVDSADALARNGVRTPARVEHARNSAPRDLLPGWLRVSYTTPGRLEGNVLVWVIPKTHYHRGDTVTVAYDPRDLRRAVVADNPEPGPLTTWTFIGFIILAIGVGLVLVQRARHIRAVRRALAATPSAQEVWTKLRRRSPFYETRRISIGSSTFSAFSKKDWHLADEQPHRALVFEGRKGCVIVDVASGSVATSGGD